LVHAKKDAPLPKPQGRGTRKTRGRKTEGVSARGGVRIDCFCCSRGEKQMKASTENEIEGKVHEVKGKIKEKVGRLANAPGLEGEGFSEKVGGKIQKKIGQVQKVVEKP
jgi:uncharacterized protein YjbJ (UPF0337 family)